MRSSERSDPLDLERGIPTTPDDSEALRRAKGARPLAFEAYLRYLGQFPPPAVGVLRAKRGPRGDLPFSLD